MKGSGVDELSKMKERQRSKIAEIGIALVEAGIVTLNEQATALGLSPSTAWSILKPGHKSSGLKPAPLVGFCGRLGFRAPSVKEYLNTCRKRSKAVMATLSDDDANLPKVSKPRRGTSSFTADLRPGSFLKKRKRTTEQASNSSTDQGGSGGRA